MATAAQLAMVATLRRERGALAHPSPERNVIDVAVPSVAAENTDEQLERSLLPTISEHSVEEEDSVATAEAELCSRLVTSPAMGVTSGEAWASSKEATAAGDADTLEVEELPGPVHPLSPSSLSALVPITTGGDAPLPPSRAVGSERGGEGYSHRADTGGCGADDVSGAFSNDSGQEEESFAADGYDRANLSGGSAGEQPSVRVTPDELSGAVSLEAAVEEVGCMLLQLRQSPHLRDGFASYSKILRREKRAAAVSSAGLRRSVPVASSSVVTPPSIALTAAALAEELRREQILKDPLLGTKGIVRPPGKAAKRALAAAAAEVAVDRAPALDNTAVPTTAIKKETWR